ncbi:hypothetical protein ATANTOWER_020704 [Ataeniobius toweri]|uniref:Uncharacterized protein n=1 Tax=Ataeniobius toweri TaxID=208326 RepID=A0ABU7BQS8_9TELE|nr:hypothetical protein [Ataeniobius toweri]
MFLIIMYMWKCPCVYEKELNYENIYVRESFSLCVCLRTKVREGCGCIIAQCSKESSGGSGGRGGLKEGCRPSGRLQMWGYCTDSPGPLWAYALPTTTSSALQQPAFVVWLECVDKKEGEVERV